MITTAWKRFSKVYGVLNSNRKTSSSDSTPITRISNWSEQWLLDEELLLKLKKRFRLAIFTGRSEKDALDALKRFGKESFFEVVITHDDVKTEETRP